jgi:hypothetical protein
VAGDDIRAAGWREDFRTLPPGWELRTIPRTKVTDFRVEPATDDHDGALLMTADHASGMFATRVHGVDLRQTPILRWRWRATTLPVEPMGARPVAMTKPSQSTSAVGDCWGRSRSPIAGRPTHRSAPKVPRRTPPAW